MTSDDGPFPRETTLRVVKSGALADLSEDPVDRYQHHFIHLIERNLETTGTSMLALDLACGVGMSALTLFAKLPQGSRLIAISDERPELKIFHEQISPAQRRQIFIRKEKADRLPFAVNLFDVVWAALPSQPLQPLRPILRQALRVLRPGGQLLLAVPLRATFAELARAIGTSLEPYKRDESYAALLSQPPQLLGEDGWRENLQRCGAIEIDVLRDTVQITIMPPLSSQPLFSRFLLPLWLGDDLTLQAKAQQLLDRAVTTGLDVTLHVACVRARRGLSEIENSRTA